VGTLFNISVWVSNAPDLGGAEVYMEFNDSIINCTRDIVPLSDPNFFYPNPPNPTILPAPPNPGYVHLGAGLARVQVAISNPSLPPAAPFGGSGLIVIYEFKVTLAPPPGGQLTCSLHINSPMNTFLLDANGNNVPDVVLSDGSYAITGPSLPRPHLALRPLNETFGPYPPSAIGQTFDEQIFINGLSATLQLANASFRLTYNATVIDVVGRVGNVTISSATWNLTSLVFTVNPDPAILDYMDMGVTPTTSPSGDVLVATIRFTVMRQQGPPSPEGTKDESDLTISNVYLYGIGGVLTLDPPENGNVIVYGLKAARAGDVNHDGVVNLEDLMLMELAFGSKVGDLRYKADYDLNGDGMINLKDFYVVCINFGKG
jgi:hypothetical protein